MKLIRPPAIKCENNYPKEHLKISRWANQHFSSNQINVFFIILQLFLQHREYSFLRKQIYASFQINCRLQLIIITHTFSSEQIFQRNQYMKIVLLWLMMIGRCGNKGKLTSSLYQVGGNSRSSHYKIGFEKRKYVFVMISKLLLITYLQILQIVSVYFKCCLLTGNEITTSWNVGVRLEVTGNSVCKVRYFN